MGKAMALHPKVTSGVVAGAVTSILMGELVRRGVTLDPQEAAGITALLSFAASYFMPGDDNATDVGSVVVVPPAKPVAPPAAVAAVAPAPPVAPVVPRPAPAEPAIVIPPGATA